MVRLHGFIVSKVVDKGIGNFNTFLTLFLKERLGFGIVRAKGMSVRNITKQRE